MLDLGFIEDVEKILRMCPSGRQTALFSATMPPPIQKLAEGYMYDPTTIRITPKKLTVDAIQQAFIEVPAQGEGGAPGRAAEGRRTRAGDHLHPHQNRRLEAGEDAEGQRPRRQGAARRPQPGRPRRGDDLLQGPPGEAAGGDRHRRPRARHRARHPRHQLRRAELLRGLRAPDRPHRPGRAHRPRDHLRDAGPARRDRPHRARRQDLDRRVGDPGGAARARAAAAPARARRAAGDEPRRRERRPRRRQPAPSRTARRATARPGRQRDTVKLFVNRGERSGITEEDLRWALREGAVLPDEAVHDVRVLHRFSFVEVDPDQAERRSTSSTGPSSRARRSGSRSPRARELVEPLVARQRVDLAEQPVEVDRLGDEAADLEVGGASASSEFWWALTISAGVSTPAARSSRSASIPDLRGIIASSRSRSGPGRLGRRPAR